MQHYMVSHLTLPPAVLVSCCPHFLLQISLSLPGVQVILVKLWLALLGPSGWNIGCHRPLYSIFNSVLCCRFHLPPALHLYPAVHIFFSRYLFQTVFLWSSAEIEFGWSIGHAPHSSPTPPAVSCRLHLPPALYLYLAVHISFSRSFFPCVVLWSSSSCKMIKLLIIF